jgi:hypothetical protein
MAANTEKKEKSGKLKIGDQWNAITIIALSQNSPLKAIAEFVENSIDAGARNVRIVRGKSKGEYYLKVIDDGEGIDDFKYVATHIGDSIKRELKKRGAENIQGEFGIGLLSFWTVGEQLTITSCGGDNNAQQMVLVKNNPGYSIRNSRRLFNTTGTELHIQPILSGIKALHGEKIQNYLAVELRERISRSGVDITIMDKVSRKELTVEPRHFHGRLLREIKTGQNPFGEIYCEFYLSEPSPERKIGLYKNGTRVLSSLTEIDAFNTEPYTSGYLEGMVDVPFLQLTPGTRGGIVYDDAFDSFCVSMEPVTEKLKQIVEEQKTAEEERASRNIFKRVQKALKSAFRMLPAETYSWLDVYGERKKKRGGEEGTAAVGAEQPEEGTATGEEEITGEEISEVSAAEDRQLKFFEIPGPLYKIMIVPGNSIINVGGSKKLRVAAKDKKGADIDDDLDVSWRIVEGSGAFDNPEAQIVTFTAGTEPELCSIEAEATDGAVTCTATARITVTDSIMPEEGKQDEPKPAKGLPRYTFKSAPGQLWRSRYDKQNNLIIVNNGHADYHFASKTTALKLRYICRLYAKELVLSNFPELSREELLERMIELGLYAEENLK